MPIQIKKSDSDKAVAVEHRLGDIVGITLPTGDPGIGVVTGYAADGYYVSPLQGSIFVASSQTAAAVNAEAEAKWDAEQKAALEKLQAEAKAAVALAEEAQLALTA